MASFNQVVLLGNLVRNVELRYTQGGTAVTDVTLAVNDKVKKNDEWVDEVTFVDVTVWGKQAEVANEYLSKGSPLLIQGRLKLDSWEKDGQKRQKLSVKADKMQLMPRAGDGSKNSAPKTPQESPAFSSENDIPF